MITQVEYVDTLIDRLKNEDSLKGFIKTAEELLPSEEARELRVQERARTVYQKFNYLTTAGFSREEALQIVLVEMRES